MSRRKKPKSSIQKRGPTKTPPSNVSTERHLQQLVTQLEQYSGPLPHPASFEAYEKTLPGAADRILAMAEGEAEHRHKKEAKVQQHSFRLNICGQIYALLITLVAIGAGAYCISIGEIWTGGFLGGLPIVSLAIIFIRTHKERNNTH